MGPGLVKPGCKASRSLSYLAIMLADLFSECFASDLEEYREREDRRRSRENSSRAAIRIVEHF